MPSVRPFDLRRQRKQRHEVFGERPIAFNRQDLAGLKRGERLAAVDRCGNRRGHPGEDNIRLIESIPSYNDLTVSKASKKGFCADPETNPRINALGAALI